MLGTRVSWGMFVQMPLPPATYMMFFTCAACFCGIETSEKGDFCHLQNEIGALKPGFFV